MPNIYILSLQIHTTWTSWSCVGFRLFSKTNFEPIHIYAYIYIQLRHILVRWNTLSIVNMKQSSIVKSIVLYMMCFLLRMTMVAPSMCYVQESRAFWSFKCAIIYIIVLVNLVCPPYIVLIQALTMWGPFLLRV